MKRSIAIMTLDMRISLLIAILIGIIMRDMAGERGRTKKEEKKRDTALIDSDGSSITFNCSKHLTDSILFSDEDTINGDISNLS
jgi:hypothetical protein